MSEPTAKELAEWLAELPEEIEHGFVVGMIAGAGPAKTLFRRFVGSSIEELTLATALSVYAELVMVWLSDKGCRLSASCYAGTFALWIPRVENPELLPTDGCRYSALAAAVRRVRAEEGKHGG